MFFLMFSTAVFFHMAFLQCRSTEFSSCDHGSKRKAQVFTGSSFQLMFYALIIINQALRDLDPCKYCIGGQIELVRGPFSLLDGTGSHKKERMTKYPSK